MSSANFLAQKLFSVKGLTGPSPAPYFLPHLARKVSGGANELTQDSLLCCHDHH